MSKPSGLQSSASVPQVFGDEDVAGQLWEVAAGYPLSLEGRAPDPGLRPVGQTSRTGLGRVFSSLWGVTSSGSPVTKPRAASGTTSGSDSRGPTSKRYGEDLPTPTRTIACSTWLSPEPDDRQWPCDRPMP